VGTFKATKKMKKHARVQFRSSPHPTPLCGGHYFVYDGRNHTHQISANSDQGFGAQRVKIYLPDRLGASPQQCTHTLVT